MALKVFCNGIWTAERAQDAGYVMSSLACPLCEESDDTFEHRLLWCPACDEVRDKHKMAFKEMKRHYNEDPLFYSRGVWAHPGDKAPKPPVKDGISADRPGFEGELSEMCEGLGGAWCFCDGSVSRHPVAELRRASWGVTFLDHDGGRQATVRGPVWRHLPQTPQAGEYVGAAAAVQLLARPTTVVGDCLGVVNGIIKLRSTATPAGVHGGLLLDAAKPENRANLKDIRWMPSHRALGEDPTPEEKVMHSGNSMVAKAAEAARLEMEDEIGQESLEEAADYCKLAVKILRAAGDVL